MTVLILSTDMLAGMRSVISAGDARKRLGALLDEVRLRGTTFVIERDGRPAAAVVPISMLERLEAERTAAFDRIDALRAKISGRTSGPALEKLVDEELSEVRKERRAADARDP